MLLDLFFLLIIFGLMQDIAFLQHSKGLIKSMYLFIFKQLCMYKIHIGQSKLESFCLGLTEIMPIQHKYAMKQLFI